MIRAFVTTLGLAIAAMVMPSTAQATTYPTTVQVGYTGFIDIASPTGIEDVAVNIAGTSVTTDLFDGIFTIDDVVANFGNSSVALGNITAALLGNTLTLTSGKSFIGTFLLNPVSFQTDGTTYASEAGSLLFGGKVMIGSETLHLVGGHGVFTAGVPEVETWVMMILGFGMLGFTIRQNRRMAIA